MPRAVRLAPWIALGCAALLSLGCDPAGAGVPVYVDTVDHSDAQVAELLWSTEFTLGYPIERVYEPGGAITVHLLNIEPGGRQGFATTRTVRGCRRRVVADPEPDVVAHELGHALGLGHVCDAKRGDGEDEGKPLCTADHDHWLMNPRTMGGYDLTDEQHDKAEREIDLVNACPRRR